MTTMKYIFIIGLFIIGGLTANAQKNNFKEAKQKYDNGDLKAAKALIDFATADKNYNTNAETWVLMSKIYGDLAADKGLQDYADGAYTAYVNIGNRPDATAADYKEAAPYLTKTLPFYERNIVELSEKAAHTTAVEEMYKANRVIEVAEEFGLQGQLQNYSDLKYGICSNGGFSYAMVGEYDEAEKVLLKAVEINDSYYRDSYYLGFVKYQKAMAIAQTTVGMEITDEESFSIAKRKQRQQKKELKNGLPYLEKAMNLMAGIEDRSQLDELYRKLKLSCMYLGMDEKMAEIDALYGSLKNG